MLAVETVQLVEELRCAEQDGLELNTSFPWTRSFQLKGKSLTALDRYIVASIFENERNNHGTSLRDFASRHGVGWNTLQRWVSALRILHNEERVILHDNIGRPPALDSLSIQILIEKVRSAAASQNAIGRRQFDSIMMDEMNSMKIRRGENCTHAKCSRNTIRKYINENFSVENCQFKTRARVRAEADPRNALSMICMVQAFCGEKCGRPEMVFNWDATQFVIDTNRDAASMKVKTEHLDDTERPLTAQSGGKIEFAIKLSSQLRQCSLSQTRACTTMPLIVSPFLTCPMSTRMERKAG